MQKAPLLGPRLGRPHGSRPVCSEGPAGWVRCWASAVVLTKAPRFHLAPGPPSVERVRPTPCTERGLWWPLVPYTGPMEVSLALPAVAWVGDTEQGRGVHRVE